MKLLKWIKTFWGLVTFKGLRLRWRRRRYEEIKAAVIERHREGFGGVVLSKKYDVKDLAAFPPPMYWLARTESQQPVLFWRKDLMTEEVGAPRLKAEPSDECR